MSRKSLIEQILTDKKFENYPDNQYVQTHNLHENLHDLYKEQLKYNMSPHYGKDMAYKIFK